MSQDHNLTKIRESNMTDRKYFLFGNIMKFTWVMVLLYFIVYPVTHSNSIVTFIWGVSTTAMLFGCILFIHVLENKEIYIISLIAFIIVLGLLQAWDKIEMKHINGFYLYITFIMSICVCSKINISKQTFDFIAVINRIIAILFIIYSFTPIATRQYYEGANRVAEYFVFNLDNSNMAGIYLFCIYCVNLIFCKSSKKVYINIVILAAVMYLIYKTNTRTCFFSAIAVTAIYLFWRKKQVNKVIIALCALFPIAFIFIYLYLFNVGYEDIEIMGKSLFSGREEVFVSYMNHIDSFVEILIGDYTELPLQNAHNAPLAIFCGIGAIGTVATYYIILKNLNHKEISQVGNIAVICILCCFIQSCGEAALFLGGFPGAIFMNTFFLLTEYKEG